MKRLHFLLSVAVATFAFYSTGHANATITNMSYASDGDGAIYCPIYTWDGNPDVLNMSGEQYWGPAHLLGTIDTDSPGDPTLTIASAIDNDTTFAWTAFHVNVYMTNNFSISTVTVNNVPVGDWTATLTSQPVLIGGQYMGQLDFNGGTPVAIGDELDFSYAITFAGSTQYSFTQEMIPVPEPGTLGLMVVGGLLLGGFAARRRGSM